MSYLAKLKQLECNDNFNNSSQVELPKPPKPPFDSFGSTNPGGNKKNIIDIAETQTEKRRQKVLSMLADNPDKTRAFVTDTETDPDNVILTVAIRGVVAFEMLIPKAKYDPFILMELIDKESLH